MTTKRSNNIEFIEKAKKIHNEKYDYSKVEYINNKTKVCIICPEHGEFWQTPNSHLKGRACPICMKEKNKQMLLENSNKQRLTTEQFILKARKIHNDKYDYSSVKYVNNYTKVNIICPIHGSFLVKPSNHLCGCGCKECMHEKQKLTKEQFILRARQIHGWKYDYSKVNYIDSQTKIHIICPEHGEFWQKPNGHLNGQGCPICGTIKIKEKLAFSKDDVLKKFIETNGNKYNYSKFEYNGYDVKSEIICPEHGSFLQTPRSHMRGVGCPYCANKHLIGESKLKELLENNFKKVLYQVKSSTIGFEWLGRQSLDFYVPEINTAIEYQGEQHFIPIKHWGNEKKFNYTRSLDIEKYHKAKNNGVKLLYFKYSKINTGNFPYDVIFDENELLSKLKSGIQL